MQRPRDKQTYQNRFYEQLGKHVLAAASMYAKIEVLLENEVFLPGPF
jgi:hypothetical protein